MGTHYEYKGTYDNQLIASTNPCKIITKLKQQYVLKGVGIPYVLAGEEGKCEPIDCMLALKAYTKNVVAKFDSNLPSTNTYEQRIPSRVG